MGLPSALRSGIAFTVLLPQLACTSASPGTEMPLGSSSSAGSSALESTTQRSQGTVVSTRATPPSSSASGPSSLTTYIPTASSTGSSTSPSTTTSTESTPTTDSTPTSPSITSPTLSGPSSTRTTSTSTRTSMSFHPSSTQTPTSTGSSYGECCDSIFPIPATITVVAAGSGVRITDATFSLQSDLAYQGTSGADGGFDGVYYFDTSYGYSGPPVTITVSAPGYVSQVVTGVASGIMSGCEPYPVCGFGPSPAATSSLVTLVPGDAGPDATLDAAADATQG